MSRILLGLVQILPISILLGVLDRHSWKPVLSISHFGKISLEPVEWRGGFSSFDTLCRRELERVSFIDERDVKGVFLGIWADFSWPRWLRELREDILGD